MVFEYFHVSLYLSDYKGCKQPKILTSATKKRASTVFPRVTAGAIISIFAPRGGDNSREGDYSRETIISNLSHRRS